MNRCHAFGLTVPVYNGESLVNPRNISNAVAHFEFCWADYLCLPTQFIAIRAQPDLTGGAAVLQPPFDLAAFEGAAFARCRLDEQEAHQQFGQRDVVRFGVAD
jgi:hypothetical protein